MSHEIRYCGGCGSQLLAEDFSRRTAIFDGIQPFCAACFLARRSPRPASLRRLRASLRLAQRRP